MRADRRGNPAFLKYILKNPPLIKGVYSNLSSLISHHLPPTTYHLPLFFPTMKYFYILLISIACITLTGCGGGGGGGDNGIVLTPQQQEFADVIYAFAAAVNEKDKVRAKNLVSTDVEISSPNFLNKLDVFLDNVESVNFSINNIGVRFIRDEEEAEILVDALISYKYNNEDCIIPDRTLEIHVEKYNNSFLGIKSFQKYRNEASAFPPVLE